MTFEEWTAEDIAAGRLVPLLREWLPPFKRPFLYDPSRRHLPAPLRALLLALPRGAAEQQGRGTRRNSRAAGTRRNSRAAGRGGMKKGAGVAPGALRPFPRRGEAQPSRSPCSETSSPSRSSSSVTRRPTTTSTTLRMIQVPMAVNTKVATVA